MQPDHSMQERDLGGVGVRWGAGVWQRPVFEGHFVCVPGGMALSSH